MALSKFFIITFLFFAGEYCYAQDYQNITIEDGLPSNNVYKITQDAQGFIWFITDKGMVKYDGEMMKTFSTKKGLLANDIWDIRVTQDGKVWYFSKSTAIGYIYDDKVYAFPSENEDEVLMPNIIYQSGNEIGFGNQAIASLENGKWTTDDQYCDIERDYKVQLLGENKKYSYSFNKENGTVTVADSLGHNSWDFVWSALDTGSIYLRGQLNSHSYLTIEHSMVNILDFNHEKVVRLSIEEIFNQSSSIYTRLTDTLGNLQLTNEYGVAALDNDYNVTSVFNTPEALNSHFSFIDRDGNIWAASLKNGVYFLPKTAQVKTLFLNQKVKTICKNKNDLFINIEGEGTSQINAKSLIPKLIIPTEDYLYDIFSSESEDYNYLTTRTEIYKWKKNQEIIQIDLESNINSNSTARQFLDDGDYGFGNTIIYLNKINLNDFSIEKKISFLGISSIKERKQSLLIGSNSGLYSINKQLDEDSKIALLDVPVTCLALMNNQDMIIGSDGYGAYILKEDTIFKIKSSKNYIIEDIVEATDGTIYLATNEGIIVLERWDDSYKLSKKILRSDGLLSNKVNSVNIVDSYLYAGSDNGLSVIDLPLLKNQNNQPEIYLDHIRIGEHLMKSDTIVSRYNDDNTVLASFGILGYKGQSSIKRDYQLLPSSNEWNSIETNQINIGNLAPNDYKLRFRISDHQDFTSTKEVTLKITPLWYQTNLFKALFFVTIILLATLLGYVLLRYFQRRNTLILTKEKEIAQIELKALRSQMNPHFVFNSLAAIQYYINNNENQVSEKYLVKFSKLIRRFFQLSGEHEIALSEEIKLLQGYLEIEKLRFKDKLNFNIEVDEDLDIDRFFVPTMLLQPIIENAVNHGVFNKEENGNVEVTFNKKSEEEILVTVIDDGVGYAKTEQRSKKKKSSGVTAERLHFLNRSGKWNIEHKIADAYLNSKYPGTKVTFSIKAIV